MASWCVLNISFPSQFADSYLWLLLYRCHPTARSRRTWHSKVSLIDLTSFLRTTLWFKQSSIVHPMSSAISSHGISTCTPMKLVTQPAQHSVVPDRFVTTKCGWAYLWNTCSPQWVRSDTFGLAYGLQWTRSFSLSSCGAVQILQPTILYIQAAAKPYVT